MMKKTQNSRHKRKTTLQNWEDRTRRKLMAYLKGAAGGYDWTNCWPGEENYIGGIAETFGFEVFERFYSTVIAELLPHVSKTHWIYFPTNLHSFNDVDELLKTLRFFKEDEGGIK